MLFTRTRLDKLAEIKNDNLTLQVSLDGDKPDIHDAYRGKGSWIKTVAGIRTLKQLGFRVTLATTETPANSSHLPELCQFHQDLGIPEEDHLIRALAKRGYASEGLEVTKMNLSPELTCNLHGVFWHPISTAPDMQVRNQLFPLREALCLVAQELEKTNRTDLLERKEFK
jgi:MoaA/NifB/PqqE/SkfB family radical SAM enzyme